ncbi:hypothetical protein ACLOJK_037453, partial [Asimina triloba]
MFVTTLIIPAPSPIHRTEAEEEEEEERAEAPIPKGPSGPSLPDEGGEDEEDEIPLSSLLSCTSRVAYSPVEESYREKVWLYGQNPGGSWHSRRSLRNLPNNTREGGIDSSATFRAKRPTRGSSS